MGQTIDELAAATGTTTRTIRSMQTQGLLDHPDLIGRTGIYATRHRMRLQSILRLQHEGFSLQSLAILLAAHDRGDTLSAVLGLSEDTHEHTDHGSDVAELYGFADLQTSDRSQRRTGRPRRALLSVVPTTVWDESQAS